MATMLLVFLKKIQFFKKILGSFQLLTLKILKTAPFFLMMAGIVQAQKYGERPPLNAPLACVKKYFSHHTQTDFETGGFSYFFKEKKGARGGWIECDLNVPRSNFSPAIPSSAHSWPAGVNTGLGYSLANRHVLRLQARADTQHHQFLSAEYCRGLSTFSIFYHTSEYLKPGVSFERHYSIFRKKTLTYAASLIWTKLGPIVSIRWAIQQQAQKRPRAPPFPGDLKALQETKKDRLGHLQRMASYCPETALESGNEENLESGGESPVVLSSYSDPEKVLYQRSSEEKWEQGFEWHSPKNKKISLILVEFKTSLPPTIQGPLKVYGDAVDLAFIHPEGVILKGVSTSGINSLLTLTGSALTEGDGKDMYGLRLSGEASCFDPKTGKNTFFQNVDFFLNRADLSIPFWWCAQKIYEKDSRGIFKNVQPPLPKIFEKFQQFMEEYPSISTKNSASPKNYCGLSVVSNKLPTVNNFDKTLQLHDFNLPCQQLKNSVSWNQYEAFALKATETLRLACPPTSQSSLKAVVLEFQEATTLHLQSAIEASDPLEWLILIHPGNIELEPSFHVDNISNLLVISGRVWRDASHTEIFGIHANGHVFLSKSLSKHQAVEEGPYFLSMQELLDLRPERFKESSTKKISSQMGDSHLERLAPPHRKKAPEKTSQRPPKIEKVNSTRHEGEREFQIAQLEDSSTGQRCILTEDIAGADLLEGQTWLLPTGKQVLLLLLQMNSDVPVVIRGALCVKNGWVDVAFVHPKGILMENISTEGIRNLLILTGHVEKDVAAKTLKSLKLRGDGAWFSPESGKTCLFNTDITISASSLLNPFWWLAQKIYQNEAGEALTECQFSNEILTEKGTHLFEEFSQTAAWHPPMAKNFWPLGVVLSADMIEGFTHPIEMRDIFTVHLDKPTDSISWNHSVRLKASPQAQYRIVFPKASAQSLKIVVIEFDQTKPLTLSGAIICEQPLDWLIAVHPDAIELKKQFCITSAENFLAVTGIVWRDPRTGIPLGIYSKGQLWVSRKQNGHYRRVMTTHFLSAAQLQFLSARLFETWAQAPPALHLTQSASNSSNAIPLPDRPIESKNSNDDSELTLENEQQSVLPPVIPFSSNAIPLPDRPIEPKNSNDDSELTLEDEQQSVLPPVIPLPSSSSAIPLPDRPIESKNSNDDSKLTLENEQQSVLPPVIPFFSNAIPLPDRPIEPKNSNDDSELSLENEQQSVLPPVIPLSDGKPKFFIEASAPRLRFNQEKVKNHFEERREDLSADGALAQINSSCTVGEKSHIDRPDRLRLPFQQVIWDRVSQKTFPEGYEWSVASEDQTTLLVEMTSIKCPEICGTLRVKGADVDLVLIHPRGIVLHDLSIEGIRNFVLLTGYFQKNHEQGAHQNLRLVGQALWLRQNTEKVLFFNNDLELDYSMLYLPFWWLGQKIYNAAAGSGEPTQWSLDVITQKGKKFFDRYAQLIRRFAPSTSSAWPLILVSESKTPVRPCITLPTPEGQVLECVAPQKEISWNRYDAAHFDSTRPLILCPPPGLTLPIKILVLEFSHDNAWDLQGSICSKELLEWLILIHPAGLTFYQQGLTLSNIRNVAAFTGRSWRHPNNGELLGLLSRQQLIVSADRQQRLTSHCCFLSPEDLKKLTPWIFDSFPRQCFNSDNRALFWDTIPYSPIGQGLCWQIPECKEQIPLLICEFSNFRESAQLFKHLKSTSDLIDLVLIHCHGLILTDVSTIGIRHLILLTGEVLKNEHQQLQGLAYSGRQAWFNSESGKILFFSTPQVLSLQQLAQPYWWLRPNDFSPQDSLVRGLAPLSADVLQRLQEEATALAWHPPMSKSHIPLCVISDRPGLTSELDLSTPNIFRLKAKGRSSKIAWHTLSGADEILKSGHGLVLEGAEPAMSPEIWVVEFCSVHPLKCTGEWRCLASGAKWVILLHSQTLEIQENFELNSPQNVLVIPGEIVRHPVSGEELGIAFHKPGFFFGQGLVSLPAFVPTSWLNKCFLWQQLNGQNPRQPLTDRSAEGSEVANPIRGGALEKQAREETENRDSLACLTTEELRPENPVESRAPVEKITQKTQDNPPSSSSFNLLSEISGAVTTIAQLALRPRTLRGDAAQKTSLGTSENARPVGMIQKLNARGLSFQRHERFPHEAVGNFGMVWNNSTAVQESELFGRVQPSLNINDPSARILLHEILDSETLHISGVLEILGEPADVVFIHPRHIVVGNVICRNVRSLTLITGACTFNFGGEFRKIEVTGEKIEILNNGITILPSEPRPHLRIYSKEIVIAAPLVGEEIDLFSMDHAISAETLGNFHEALERSPSLKSKKNTSSAGVFIQSKARILAENLRVCSTIVNSPIEIQGSEMSNVWVEQQIYAKTCLLQTLQGNIQMQGRVSVQENLTCRALNFHLHEHGAILTESTSNPLLNLDLHLAQQLQCDGTIAPFKEAHVTASNVSIGKQGVFSGQKISMTLQEAWGNQGTSSFSEGQLVSKNAQNEGQLILTSDGHFSFQTQEKFINTATGSLKVASKECRFQAKTWRNHGSETFHHPEGMVVIKVVDLVNDGILSFLGPQGTSTVHAQSLLNNSTIVFCHHLCLEASDITLSSQSSLSAGTGSDQTIFSILATQILRSKGKIIGIQQLDMKAQWLYLEETSQTACKNISAKIGEDAVLSGVASLGSGTFQSKNFFQKGTMALEEAEPFSLTITNNFENNKTVRFKNKTVFVQAQTFKNEGGIECSNSKGESTFKIRKSFSNSGNLTCKCALIISPVLQFYNDSGTLKGEELLVIECATGQNRSGLIQSNRKVILTAKGKSPASTNNSGSFDNNQGSIIALPIVLEKNGGCPSKKTGTEQCIIHTSLLSNLKGVIRSGGTLECQTHQPDEKGVIENSKGFMECAGILSLRGVLNNEEGQIHQHPSSASGINHLAIESLNNLSGQIFLDQETELKIGAFSNAKGVFRANRGLSLYGQLPRKDLHIDGKLEVERNASLLLLDINNLKIDGKIRGGAVKCCAGTFVLAGAIEASTITVEVTTLNLLENSLIKATNDSTLIKAESDLDDDLRGEGASPNDLTISVQEDFKHDGQCSTEGKCYISVKKGLYNTGTIKGKKVQISALSISNQGKNHSNSAIITGKKNLKMTAVESIENKSFGILISPRGSISLRKNSTSEKALQVFNAPGASILAYHDIFCDCAIFKNGQVQKTSEIAEIMVGFNLILASSEIYLEPHSKICSPLGIELIAEKIQVESGIEITSGASEKPALTVQIYAQDLCFGKVQNTPPNQEQEIDLSQIQHLKIAAKTLWFHVPCHLGSIVEITKAPLCSVVYEGYPKTRGGEELQIKSKVFGATQLRCCVAEVTLHYKASLSVSKLDLFIEPGSIKHDAGLLKILPEALLSADELTISEGSTSIQEGFDHSPSMLIIKRGGVLSAGKLSIKLKYFKNEGVVTSDSETSIVTKYLCNTSGGSIFGHSLNIITEILINSDRILSETDIWHNANLLERSISRQAIIGRDAELDAAIKFFKACPSTGPMKEASDETDPTKPIKGAMMAAKMGGKLRLEVTNQGINLRSVILSHEHLEMVVPNGRLLNLSGIIQSFSTLSVQAALILNADIDISVETCPNFTAPVSEKMLPPKSKGEPETITIAREAAQGHLIEYAIEPGSALIGEVDEDTRKIVFVDYLNFLVKVLDLMTLEEDFLRTLAGAMPLSSEKLDSIKQLYYAQGTLCAEIVEEILKSIQQLSDEFTEFFNDYLTYPELWNSMVIFMLENVHGCLQMTLAKAQSLVRRLVMAEDALFSFGTEICPKNDMFPDILKHISILRSDIEDLQFISQALPGATPSSNGWKWRYGVERSYALKRKALTYLMIFFWKMHLLSHSLAARVKNEDLAKVLEEQTGTLEALKRLAAYKIEAISTQLSELMKQRSDFKKIVREIRTQRYQKHQVTIDNQVPGSEQCLFSRRKLGIRPPSSEHFDETNHLRRVDNLLEWETLKQHKIFPPCKEDPTRSMLYFDEVPTLSTSYSKITSRLFYQPLKHITAPGSSISAVNQTDLLAQRVYNWFGMIASIKGACSINGADHKTESKSSCLIQKSTWTVSTQYVENHETCKQVSEGSILGSLFGWTKTEKKSSTKKFPGPLVECPLASDTPLTQLTPEAFSNAILPASFQFSTKNERGDMEKKKEFAKNLEEVIRTIDNRLNARVEPSNSATSYEIAVKNNQTEPISVGAFLTKVQNLDSASIDRLLKDIDEQQCETLSTAFDLLSYRPGGALLRGKLEAWIEKVEIKLEAGERRQTMAANVQKGTQLAFERLVENRHYLPLNTPDIYKKATHLFKGVGNFLKVCGGGLSKVVGKGVLLKGFQQVTLEGELLSHENLAIEDAGTITNGANTVVETDGEFRAEAQQNIELNDQCRLQGASGIHLTSHKNSIHLKGVTLISGGEVECHAADCILLEPVIETQIHHEEQETETKNSTITQTDGVLEGSFFAKEFLYKSCDTQKEVAHRTNIFGRQVKLSGKNILDHGSVIVGEESLNLTAKESIIAEPAVQKTSYELESRSKETTQSSWGLGWNESLHFSTTKQSENKKGTIIEECPVASQWASCGGHINLEAKEGFVRTKGTQISTNVTDTQDAEKQKTMISERACVLDQQDSCPDHIKGKQTQENIDDFGMQSKTNAVSTEHPENKLDPGSKAASARAPPHSEQIQHTGSQGKLNIFARHFEDLPAPFAITQHIQTEHQTSGWNSSGSHGVITTVECAKTLYEAVENAESETAVTTAAAGGALGVQGSNVVWNTIRGTKKVLATGGDYLKSATSAAAQLNASANIGYSSTNSTTLQQSSESHPQTSKFEANEVRLDISGDIHLVGTDVQAKRTTVKAENFKAESATDSQSSSLTQRSSTIGVALNVGIGGPYGAQVGLELQGQTAHRTAHDERSTQKQASIAGSENLVMNITKDMALEGAMAQGEKATIAVGGDLRVASKTDTFSHSDSSTAHSGTIGVNFSAISATKVSGSIGYSHSTSSGEVSSKSVQQLSGISSGSCGFQVEVKGNLEMESGIIQDTNGGNSSAIQVEGSMTMSAISEEHHAHFKNSEHSIGAATQPFAKGGTAQLPAIHGIGPASTFSTSTVKDKKQIVSSKLSVNIGEKSILGQSETLLSGKSAGTSEHHSLGEIDLQKLETQHKAKTKAIRQFQQVSHNFINQRRADAMEHEALAKNALEELSGNLHYTIPGRKKQSPGIEQIRQRAFAEKQNAEWYYHYFGATGWAATGLNAAVFGFTHGSSSSLWQVAGHGAIHGLEKLLIAQITQHALPLSDRATTWWAQKTTPEQITVPFTVASAQFLHEAVQHYFTHEPIHWQNIGAAALGVGLTMQVSNFKMLPQEGSIQETQSTINAICALIEMSGSIANHCTEAQVVAEHVAVYLQQVYQSSVQATEKQSWAKATPKGTQSIIDDFHRDLSGLKNIFKSALEQVPRTKEDQDILKKSLQEKLIAAQEPITLSEYALLIAIHQVQAPKGKKLAAVSQVRSHIAKIHGAREEVRDRHEKLESFTEDKKASASRYTCVVVGDQIQEPDTNEFFASSFRYFFEELTVENEYQLRNSLELETAYATFLEEKDPESAAFSKIFSDNNFSVRELQLIETEHVNAIITAAEEASQQYGFSIWHKNSCIPIGKENKTTEFLVMIPDQELRALISKAALKILLGPLDQENEISSKDHLKKRLSETFNLLYQERKSELRKKLAEENSGKGGKTISFIREIEFVRQARANCERNRLEEAKKLSTNENIQNLPPELLNQFMLGDPGARQKICVLLQRGVAAKQKEKIAEILSGEATRESERRMKQKIQEKLKKSLSTNFILRKCCEEAFKNSENDPNNRPIMKELVEKRLGNKEYKEERESRIKAIAMDHLEIHQYLYNRFDQAWDPLGGDTPPPVFYKNYFYPQAEKEVQQEEQQALEQATAYDHAMLLDSFVFIGPLSAFPASLLAALPPEGQANLKAAIERGEQISVDGIKKLFQTSPSSSMPNLEELIHSANTISLADFFQNFNQTLIRITPHARRLDVENIPLAAQPEHLKRWQEEIRAIENQALQKTQTAEINIMRGPKFLQCLVSPDSIWFNPDVAFDLVCLAHSTLQLFMKHRAPPSPLLNFKQRYASRPHRRLPGWISNRIERFALLRLLRAEGLDPDCSAHLFTLNEAIRVSNEGFRAFVIAAAKEGAQGLAITLLTSGTGTIPTASNTIFKGICVLKAGQTVYNAINICIDYANNHSTSTELAWALSSVALELTSRNLQFGKIKFAALRSIQKIDPVSLVNNSMRLYSIATVVIPLLQSDCFQDRVELLTLLAINAATEHLGKNIVNRIAHRPHNGGPVAVRVSSIYELQYPGDRLVVVEVAVAKYKSSKKKSRRGRPRNKSEKPVLVVNEKGQVICPNSSSDSLNFSTKGAIDAGKKQRHSRELQTARNASGEASQSPKSLPDHTANRPTSDELAAAHATASSFSEEGDRLAPQAIIIKFIPEELLQLEDQNQAASRVQASGNPPGEGAPSSSSPSMTTASTAAVPSAPGQAQSSETQKKSENRAATSKTPDITAHSAEKPLGQIKASGPQKKLVAPIAASKAKAAGSTNDSKALRAATHVAEKYSSQSRVQQSSLTQKNPGDLAVDTLSSTATTSPRATEPPPIQKETIALLEQKQSPPLKAAAVPHREHLQQNKSLPTTRQALVAEIEAILSPREEQQTRCYPIRGPPQNQERSENKILLTASYSELRTHDPTVKKNGQWPDFFNKIRSVFPEARDAIHHLMQKRDRSDGTIILGEDDQGRLQLTCCVEGRVVQLATSSAPFFTHDNLQKALGTLVTHVTQSRQCNAFTALAEADLGLIKHNHLDLTQQPLDFYARLPPWMQKKLNSFIKIERRKNAQAGKKTKEEAQNASQYHLLLKAFKKIILKGHMPWHDCFVGNPAKNGMRQIRFIINGRIHKIFLCTPEEEKQFRGLVSALQGETAELALERGILKAANKLPPGTPAFDFHIAAEKRGINVKSFSNWGGDPKRFKRSLGGHMGSFKRAIKQLELAKAKWKEHRKPEDKKINPVSRRREKNNASPPDTEVHTLHLVVPEKLTQEQWSILQETQSRLIESNSTITLEVTTTKDF